MKKEIQQKKNKNTANKRTNSLTYLWVLAKFKGPKSLWNGS
jgi:hypothetical protein